MAKTKKSDLRAAARKSLEQDGYVVREETGRGVLPGARLTAIKQNTEHRVAVRTTLDRTVGFSRDANGEWRTLRKATYVCVAAFAQNDLSTVEVYRFAQKDLIKQFDLALKEMTAAGKAPAADMPIFIPLDDGFKKSLGHEVAGLKELAKKSHSFNRKEMGALVQGAGVDGFIERVRREFADLVGADVSRVKINLRVDEA